MYYEIDEVITSRNVPISGSSSVFVSVSVVYDHKFDTFSFTVMEEINLYIIPIYFCF
jgi:hypothetical protein